MIDSISIENFKSIRKTGRIQINPINILIGSNGVGKTNFINFFKFLNRLYKQDLQNYIARTGRADGILHFGRKASPYLTGEIVFRNDEDRISNRYRFQMDPDQSNSLFFSAEYTDYNMQAQLSNRVSWSNFLMNTGGTTESRLPEDTSLRTSYLRGFFESFRVFHFHDTSDSSKLRNFSNLSDNETFQEDGSNLATILYGIQKSSPNRFKMIEYAIRSVAPFFNTFYLVPDKHKNDEIELRWTEKGKDNLFNAHSLSDGTLRFIALSTLLLQQEPPSTIIIDEPELGLHPSAIIKLGSMLKSASTKSQIIVSTQSVNLLDQFSPEDILVVEREDSQTVFKRHTKEELSTWLETYSMGELWSKNILGGTP